MDTNNAKVLPGQDDPAAIALRDELARQYSILTKDTPVRLITTTMAFALTGFFLPLPLVGIFLATNVLGELFSLRLLRGLDPRANPSAYRKCLTLVFILELAFCILPAALWHEEGPYLKAFAVGLAVFTIMHVSTVRAIHLPMAVTGLAAIAVATSVSNTAFWIIRGDAISLAFTTVCLFAGMAYALGATVSNNRLHQETARGRAEAQAANAAKGTFLAQMSHELRTPLNAILGMGHAELHRTDDPISQERLSVLISSAESLSAILDDILDMSAVQGGHLPVRRRPTELRREISATVALFRPQIEEAGLQLYLDQSADLPDWVMLDGQRLRQCLSNLLSNAVKNTTAGEIRISVQRQSRIDALPLLRVVVSDTGPGIPPDKAESMFEPFVRGPGTSLGTGLGLSITRALARQMGGDLHLKPRTEGDAPGATFVLSVEMETTEPPEATGLRGAAAGLDLTGRRVLVVDDIATNRLVAATFLRSFGADTLEAESGADAVQILANDAVDLVLLDMNMPGLNGLETFAELRKLPGANGQVPVVAMTANTLADHWETYQSAGLNGFLGKPITPENFAEEITRVLQPNRKSPAQPSP